MLNKRDENLISFSQGEPIFTEREPGNNKMYLIEKGRVEVSQGGMVIARLGVGQPIIGEMSLLLNEPRSATVKALNSVELLEITGENFGEIIAERPGLNRTIKKSLVQRLEATTRALAEARGEILPKQPGTEEWIIMEALAQRLKVITRDLSKAQSELKKA